MQIGVQLTTDLPEFKVGWVPYGHTGSCRLARVRADPPSSAGRSTGKRMRMSLLRLNTFKFTATLAGALGLLLAGNAHAQCGGAIAATMITPANSSTLGGASVTFAGRLAPVSLSTHCLSVAPWERVTFIRRAKALT
jgi:hypothetical protein